MQKNSKIFVAGHNGLVGSAICRALTKNGYTNLLVQTRDELDLLSQQAVNQFFSDEKPEYVFIAAAKVGGIYANNTYPAEFIYNNLMIQSNIIHASHLNDVKKLMFLGSSCIYPKLAPQPMKEEHLLTGPLEPTNEPYALAKISGIKMCAAYHRQYGSNFVSVMPTNLYGENDNFHPENSHVLPALMRRFHEAKLANQDSVLVWGTGSAKREFIHVDDLADACLFLMLKDEYFEFVNIGTGIDASIKDLAFLLKGIVGYEGKIEFDTTKPDGTPRKLQDVSKLTALGWQSKIDLKEGLEETYKWFLDHHDDYRS